MPRQKRRWQPREQRMVSEWLAKNYGQYSYRTRVRLGSIHPTLHPERLSAEERNLVGLWRRWADAVVFLPDRLLLIEAKIRPEPGVISQLDLYSSLLPQTPELAEWQHLPIEKVLLYAIDDPALIALARQHGIRCIMYQPEWLDDYLRILFPRERSGHRT